MSYIKVLPSEIFNRIAAGEVIENPSSVVKELVENSIDAGATEIVIEANCGGKYIKVSDNGAGIAADDLPVAFMPHATSKIKEIKDLDEIKTLGFRGEALPSIASVAKVTAVSRKQNSDFASKLIIENGKIAGQEEIGAPLGTSIIVEDIFKNVPARLKFLKTDKTEEGNISSLIGKFIIANYNVSIVLTVNGKEIYRSSGKGVQDAIFAVYGSHFLKEMSYIESIMPDIELFGYVNKPNFSRHNRTYQTLVINGRYVVNSDISFWIYNCFSSLLMKRQYPAFVIYINLPYDMVDINVHPNKMDVKFVDFDRIRRMLSHAIGDALKAETALPKELEIDHKPSDHAASPEKTSFGEFFKMGTDNGLEDSDNGSFKTSSIDFHMPATSINNRFNRLHEPVSQTEKLINDTLTEDRSFTVKETPSFYDDVLSYKVVGKLFNTYIMIEAAQQIIIIDQHAAHERILFDKFSGAINNGTNSVQNMLIPYVFDLSVSEAALLDDALVSIEAMGFNITKLSGNSYSMSGIPMLFNDLDMREFVSLLMNALATGKRNKADFIRDTVAQTACKAAIKGEMDLSDEDMKRLIGQISFSKIPLFCPHGRPIAIKLTKTEIEKWFKRIV